MDSGSVVNKSNIADGSAPNGTANESPSPNGNGFEVKHNKNAAGKTQSATPQRVEAPKHETIVVKKEKKRSPVRRVVLSLIGLGVLAFAAYYGINKLTFAQSHEETDDAQIDADITPLIPRVSGYVTSVSVSDNTHVTEGSVLVQLDARELQIKVNNARAALQSAQAAVTTARLNLATIDVSRKKADED